MRDNQLLTSGNVFWMDQGTGILAMMRILPRIAALVANNRAATAIEYGLIVAMIAIAGVGAFSALGDSVHGAWGNVANTAKAHM